MSIRASGVGTALFDVNFRYNVRNVAALRAFELLVEPDDADKEVLRIGVCARYLLSGDSSMTVIELDLPSGLVVIQRCRFEFVFREIPRCAKTPTTCIKKTIVRLLYVETEIV